MTVPAAAGLAGPYNCSGTTGPYTFAFKILTSGELEVILTDSAGVETVLTETTHYSVSGVGSDSGGSITTVASYAAGNKITLRLNPDVEQTTNFAALGGFAPATHTAGLDKIIQMVKSLNETMARTLRVKRSVANLPEASLDSDSAGFVAIDANGDPYLSAGATGAPASSFMATVLDDTTVGEAVSTLESVRKADGLSDLRANFTPGVDTTVYLKYHTSAGDGGHGFFRGVTGAAPGTYTDNGGTIILPTGGNGSAAWLRDYPSAADVRWFGAVGDGVTDDTTALTNFFNSAISHPGVEHRFEAKIYAVSAVLPTINVSNVVIKGEGSEIHDVGAQLVTGTVLKWIGASGTVGPLIQLSSISGASNPRVSDVEFSGIGIDCNNGSIDYGIELLSIRDSFIDVSVANAGAAGMNINVVASLGEAKDVQRNIIRLKARQIEKRDAFCLTAGGDSAGNTSMNEFWVNCQHTDLQAISLSDVDNNDWVFVRTHKTASGTVSESIALLGGATAGNRARAERFHFLTCNTPVHVYGSSSYTYASTDHKIYCLDTENGSPIPAVDPGGSIRVQKDTTNLPDDPWVAYTPTLSATSGAFTSASATGFYLRRGKIVHVKVQISITTNGTAAGTLGITVPIASVGSVGHTFCGRERAVTGKAVLGFLDAGVSVCSLRSYDGTYPGGDGYSISVSGFYEVP